MALTPEQKKAQREAAKEDVLLREVDDAYRQDQYANFAKTYGKPLIGLLIVGLAALGAYAFWDSRQEAAMEEKSEQLIAALDNLEAGNLDTANDALTPLAGDIEDGAGATAAMLQAGILSQQGKPDEAAALFTRVAEDSDTPEPLRNLATIRAVAANFDDREPADIIARLRPLAEPGNPWFGSAGELVAMAYLEQGKTREAGTLLSQIAKDDGVTESIRSRARQVAGLLGVDAIEDVDALLEQQGITGEVEAPATQ